MAFSDLLNSDGEVSAETRKLLADAVVMLQARYAWLFHYKRQCGQCRRGQLCDRGAELAAAVVPYLEPCEVWYGVHRPAAYAPPF